MKNVICFAIGDWVTWRGSDGYDSEEKLALTGIRKIMGDGPFEIDGVFPVADEDVEGQKHEQYLEFNDERGRPIKKDDGERYIVSAYWFMKTKIPKRLIN